jgi:hypothetical protein
MKPKTAIRFEAAVQDRRSGYFRGVRKVYKSGIFHSQEALWIPPGSSSLRRR